ncbi:hypothetical protein [Microbacterium sp. NPDC055665]
MPFPSTQELTLPASPASESAWYTLLWVSVGIAAGILLGTAITIAAALGGTVT